jgi:hypothetical protein
MACYIFFVFIELFASAYCALGQTHACIVKVVRLEFEKTRQVGPEEITDSLLALARPTSYVLVEDSEISGFQIRTDTACCNYAGPIIGTSHRYSLADKARARLLALNIPLCCGIPVAVYIDNEEVYRASLWNPLSSFGSRCLAMTLIRDGLMVANHLPIVADSGDSILTKKSYLLKCLLER